MSDGISSFPAPFLRTIEEAGGIIPIAATSMAIILGSGFRLVSRGCLSSFAGGVFWAVPFFESKVKRIAIHGLGYLVLVKRVVSCQPPFDAPFDDGADAVEDEDELKHDAIEVAQKRIG